MSQAEPPDPVDHVAEGEQFLLEAHTHLRKPPQGVAGEYGVTTHTIARDQLATAQVHALFALNATLERLCDLLATEPETTMNMHVEADPQAVQEVLGEIRRDQRRHQ